MPGRGIVETGCLSSGGHAQDFEPVVAGEWGLRPFRAQKGGAIVFDEDRFGDETEFVYQIGHGFRLNFLLFDRSRKDS